METCKKLHVPLMYAYGCSIMWSMTYTHVHVGPRSVVGNWNASVRQRSVPLSLVLIPPTFSTGMALTVLASPLTSLFQLAPRAVTRPSGTLPPQRCSFTGRQSPAALLLTINANMTFSCTSSSWRNWRSNKCQPPKCRVSKFVAKDTE